MSWTSENVMDIDITEMENNQIKNRQDLWATGYHQLRSGDRVKISNMSIGHLKNTIAWFNKKDNYDTSCFNVELTRKLCQ